MQDLLMNIIMSFIAWIKKNYKKPKLWLLLVALLILVYWLIPYIDSNIFYYDRMEKRVTILQQLTELDQEKINADPILQSEYQDILEDIEVQEERMVNSIVSNMSDAINGFFKVKPQEGKTWIKFLSGAALFALITLFIPFMNTFSSKKDKILGMIILLILACILGGAAVLLPIIIHPNVNYLGVPIVQLIILIILAVKTS